MRALLLCLAMGHLAIASGCREFPIARGPEYHIGPRPLPAILRTGGTRTALFTEVGGAEPDNTPAAVIPLDLQDHRPLWETHYHAPATEPAAWKRAVGFVAMENVQPSLKDLLLATVNGAAAAMPERPTWGIVHVDSFRIVVNNAEQKHREYEERQRDLELELERSREPMFLLSFTNGGPAGLGFGSSLERRPGLRAATPVYSDAEPLIVPSSRIVNGERELVGAPKELPLRYGPGVTCEMMLRIELYFDGGRRDDFHIVASHHVYAPGWVVYDLSTEIPNAVHGALDDLRTKLVTQSTRPPGSSVGRQTPPASGERGRGEGASGPFIFCRAETPDFWIGRDANGFTIPPPHPQPLSPEAGERGVLSAAFTSRNPLPAHRGTSRPSPHGCARRLRAKGPTRGPCPDGC